MQKKISTTFFTFMLILAGSIILPNNIKVKGNPEQNENIELDFQYIKNITTNLSQIIYNYPDGLLPEGRAFGSWGELNASIYLFSLMQELDLDPVKERIMEYPDDEIDDKIEVKAKAVKINGTYPADCYISPRWNDSYVKKIAGQFNSTEKNLLTHNFSLLFSSLSLL